jgi:8-oxo-dGTP diphosphatase
VREWVVGGAVVEGPDGLLLVCNRRRDGSCDWTPPGGVIDAGESVLEGLTREVAEETGLAVSAWHGPLYEVVVEAVDLGWHLRVEAWRAEAYTGELTIEDPDGIVVDARFVAHAECAPYLHSVHPWVREPLSEWMLERWVDTRPYRFHVAGTDRSALVVTRH